MPYFCSPAFTSIIFIKEGFGKDYGYWVCLKLSHLGKEMEDLLLLWGMGQHTCQSVVFSYLSSTLFGKEV